MAKILFFKKFVGRYYPKIDCREGFPASLTTNTDALGDILAIDN